MDHLTIDIPEGLDEATKSALAQRLSRLAQQSVAEQATTRPSGVRLAGRLASPQPRLSDEQEQAIARQHIADHFRESSA